MVTSRELQEAGIIWLHDPLKFRYLREAVYITTRRRQKPPERRGRVIVGYAVHHKRGVGIVAYRRRYWHLKDYDRDLDPDGPYAVHNFRFGPSPHEAVIPSSVHVGHKSIPYGGSTLCAEDWEARESMERRARGEA